MLPAAAARVLLSSTSTSSRALMPTTSSACCAALSARLASSSSTSTSSPTGPLLPRSVHPLSPGEDRRRATGKHAAIGGNGSGRIGSEFDVSGGSALPPSERQHGDARSGLVRGASVVRGEENSAAGKRERGREKAIGAAGVDKPRKKKLNLPLDDKKKTHSKTLFSSGPTTRSPGRPTSSAGPCCPGPRGDRSRPCL